MSNYREYEYKGKAYSSKYSDVKRYYGLTHATDLKLLVVEVCDCLGHGSTGTAVELILETMGAETNRGETKDPTIYAGMGICQFDKMPFQDMKDRTSASNKAKIYETFGISLDLVEWEHLRYSPLLSIIACRLKYLLVKEGIPNTFEGRAMYWKRFYNSMLGKGTTDHYIFANLKYKVPN